MSHYLMSLIVVKKSLNTQEKVLIFVIDHKISNTTPAEVLEV